MTTLLEPPTEERKEAAPKKKTEQTTIIEALVKLQASLPPIIKDKENPFFSSWYADLASIWDVIRKPMTDLGLCVVQCPEATDGETIRIRTVLLHKSGEFIDSVLVLKPVQALVDKNANERAITPQTMGSAITYARRYALCAMLGIAPEDDDGNAASQRGRAPRAESTETIDGLLPDKQADRPASKWQPFFDACQEASNRDCANGEGQGWNLTDTDRRSIYQQLIALAPEAARDPQEAATWIRNHGSLSLVEDGGLIVGITLKVRKDKT